MQYPFNSFTQGCAGMATAVRPASSPSRMLVAGNGMSCLRETTERDTRRAQGIFRHPGAGPSGEAHAPVAPQRAGPLPHNPSVVSPTARKESLRRRCVWRMRIMDDIGGLAMTIRHHGFTLVEALVAVAIVVLMLLVAVPALTATAAAARSGAALGELSATVLESVRHSALAGVSVVVCPDGGTGACIDDATWSAGWIAFADENGNRTRDPGDTLLHRAGALPRGVALQSTAGRTRLVFHPNGSNAGSNVTFTLCDRRGAARATSVVLANDGRLRSTTATPAAASRCIAALGR